MFGLSDLCGLAICAFSGSARSHSTVRCHDFKHSPPLLAGAPQEGIYHYQCLLGQTVDGDCGRGWVEGNRSLKSVFRQNSALIIQSMKYLSLSEKMLLVRII